MKTSVVYKHILLLLFSLFFMESRAQYKLDCLVIDSKSNSVLVAASVFSEDLNLSSYTNAEGLTRFTFQEKGVYTIKAYSIGYKLWEQDIEINSDTLIVIKLQLLSQDLPELKIEDKKGTIFNLETMNSVEGVGIYAGKKTEVILTEGITANKSANTARQIYSKVAGLNVWESDGAGIQLGIGVRGLSPSRTANINVRQNGYDISADALGYPESYYTPPVEALEKIEFVRGAASLQYGTQFGGMLNFVMKKGPADKKLEVNTRQTTGSNAFFNSFNSIGGTKGKSNYYAFYQYKTGDGWRENSEFKVHTAYVNYNYQLNPKLLLNAEFTHMNYEARQAGGLTDKAFEEDPQMSVRNRNWFRVNWNLASFSADYVFSPATRINLRTFGLYASRESLGYLGSADRSDDESLNRNLIRGKFANLGSEIRLLHHHELFNKRSISLIGARAYKGNNLSGQGNANSQGTPDFYFLNPGDLENSDYDFDNINYAVFAETVFYLKDNLTITPGVRVEFINTSGNGYYKTFLRDNAGNILEENQTFENRERSRSFALGGIGISFKPTTSLEFYGNISQNYRAINFSDIRIENPSLRIDENIRDEKGYNIDLGMRGQAKHFLSYDLSLFYLSYEDRIGTLQKRDPDNYRVYQYRSNVGNSRTYGLEGFVEFAPLRMGKEPSERKFDFSVFTNLSLLRGTYYNTEETAVDGNKVELVPEITSRSGITARYKSLTATAQYSFVGEQFTDATNAVQTNSGINGIVPAYYVADLSLKYLYKKFILESGINNLTNNYYFTRRASGYPGPGILPSDGRTFYLTLGAKF